MTRRWLLAIAAALAVPALGWLMIQWLNATLEGYWQTALIARYGSIPADAVNALRLESLCAQPDFVARTEGLCNDTQTLGLLRWVAGLAVGAAAVIVVAVGLAARFARRGPDAMAALFPRTLTIVLVAAALLLLLQGALILGVLWEFMQIGGWVWPWLLAAVGATTLLGSAGALRSVQKLRERRALTVDGLALTRRDEPALFAEVDDVAAAIDADPPATIIAGFEPTFFVVDAAVAALDSAHDGPTLFLSLPVAGLLTRDEFRAILGHELGHLTADDTRFTREVAPLYGAAGDAFGRLALASRRGLGLVAVPAVMMLQAVFGTLFESLGDMKRRRELAADQAGAEASSPAALASALVKLTRVQWAWESTRGAYVQALTIGAPLASVTQEYLRRARAAEQRPDEVDGRISHPFDSHPPTHVRLEALGVGHADRQALDLAPADSALSLFSDAAALDARIGQLLAQRVRPHITPGVERQFTGPSAALRRAALDDEGIAAAIAMIGAARGPDISRPERPGVAWVALTDLLLTAHTGALDYDWDVADEDVPQGPPWLVADVAVPGDRPSRIIAKGTRLHFLGGISPLDDEGGVGEDVYAGPAGEPWARGPVVVRAVGGGDVRPQAAGLFVTLVTDWLNAGDGATSPEVAAAAEAMRRTRKRSATTAGRANATAPDLAPAARAEA